MVARVNPVLMLPDPGVPLAYTCNDVATYIAIETVLPSLHPAPPSALRIQPPDWPVSRSFCNTCNMEELYRDGVPLARPWGTPFPPVITKVTKLFSGQNTRNRVTFGNAFYAGLYIGFSM